MKTNTLSFDVLGVPKPYVRPRVANGGVKMDRATEHWKWQIRDAAAEAIGRSTWPRLCKSAVTVSLKFVGVVRAARAKRPAEPHIIRPDLDNLTKPVLDAMKLAGVYRDDCVIVKLEASKRWQRGGERFAGVKVRVGTETVSRRNDSEEE